MFGGRKGSSSHYRYSDFTAYFGYPDEAGRYAIMRTKVYGSRVGSEVEINIMKFLAY